MIVAVIGPRYLSSSRSTDLGAAFPAPAEKLPTTSSRTASGDTSSFPAAATYGILRHDLAFTPNPPGAERHVLSLEAHSVSDTNPSSFIWSIAELLRNDYKQSEYVKVIPEAMREHLLTQAAGSMV